MSAVIIDVRERDEFAAEHIENAIHIPLSELNRQAPAILKHLNGQKILLMCASGKRAGLAAQQMASFSHGLDVSVFEGGMMTWKREGGRTIAAKNFYLPIIRQVHLVAGSLVILGVLLSHFVNPSFIWLAGFVGAGLAFAGATGFCGMAEILARMPWNKL